MDIFGGPSQNWTIFGGSFLCIFFLRSCYKMGDFWGVAKISNIWGLLETPDIFGSDNRCLARAYV